MLYLSAVMGLVLQAGMSGGTALNLIQVLPLSILLNGMLWLSVNRFCHSGENSLLGCLVVTTGLVQSLLQYRRIAPIGFESRNIQWIVPLFLLASAIGMKIENAEEFKILSRILMGVMAVSAVLLGVSCHDVMRIENLSLNGEGKSLIPGIMIIPEVFLLSNREWKLNPKEVWKCVGGLAVTECILMLFLELIYGTRSMEFPMASAVKMGTLFVFDRMEGYQFLLWTFLVLFRIAIFLSVISKVKLRLFLSAGAAAIYTLLTGMSVEAEMVDSGMILIWLVGIAFSALGGWSEWKKAGCGSGGD